MSKGPARIFRLTGPFIVSVSTSRNHSHTCHDVVPPNDPEPLYTDTRLGPESWQPRHPFQDFAPIQVRRNRAQWENTSSRNNLRGSLRQTPLQTARRYYLRERRETL